MPKKDEFEVIHMTNAQIEETKREIEAAEKMLNDPRPWVRNKITDEAEILKGIKKKKQLIKDFSPKRMRGQKANKAFREAKELAKFLHDQMPDSNQYFQRHPKSSDGHKRTMEFERVVAQQVKFQTDPQIQRAIIRFKNIMRRIDPQDPTITNIESLRDGIPSILRET